MSKDIIFTKVLEPGILSVMIKNYKKRNALSNDIKTEMEKIAFKVQTPRKI